MAGGGVHGKGIGIAHGTMVQAGATIDQNRWQWAVARHGLPDYQATSRENKSSEPGAKGHSSEHISSTYQVGTRGDDVNPCWLTFCVHCEIPRNTIQYKRDERFTFLK